MPKLAQIIERTVKRWHSRLQLACATSLFLLHFESSDVICDLIGSLSNHDDDNV